jgi:hypothetical protein
VVDEAASGLGTPRGGRIPQFNHQKKDAAERAASLTPVWAVQTCLAMSSPSLALGKTPTIFSAAWPPLNRINVGMAMMP